MTHATALLNWHLGLWLAESSRLQMCAVLGAQLGPKDKVYNDRDFDALFNIPNVGVFYSKVSLV